LKRKVFIKSYGCQMNVYDATRMADVLAPLGYRATDTPDDADLVILNTCHIREKAAEKVYSDLGRLRHRAGTGGAVLAVAGCVAQAEGAEIRRRAPFVDMVFGPQAYHRLPEMLATLERQRAGGTGPGRGVVDTEFPVEAKFDHLPEEAAPRGPAAFVTVQEGCDKFCTFCVVPYTRGAEFSRPPAAVAAEVRRLVAGGTVEVTLLGQNVNAYHGADPGAAPLDLAGLVRMLARIAGLERIRFTTSHPRDMNAALLAEFTAEPKLMPYLHLPVQAGSDRILAAMNRGYTAADYVALAARLRAARPDIALSSDFIVGFPGESDADFDATMALIDRVGFAGAYSFKYSARPGTPAALLPGQVPEPVKEARLAALQALLRDQQQAFNRACVGQVMPVLLEGPGRRPGQLLGRSPYLQPVHAAAPAALRGRIARVRIDAVLNNSLSGTLVDAQAALPAEAVA